MKFCLLGITLSLCLSMQKSNAQTKIIVSEAKNHIDEYVSITGLVYKYSYKKYRTQSGYEYLIAYLKDKDHPSSTAFLVFFKANLKTNDSSLIMHNGKQIMQTVPYPMDIDGRIVRYKKWLAIFTYAMEFPINGPVG